MNQPSPSLSFFETSRGTRTSTVTRFSFMPRTSFTSAWYVQLCESIGTRSTFRSRMTSTGVCDVVFTRASDIRVSRNEEWNTAGRSAVICNGVRAPGSPSPSRLTRTPKRSLAPMSGKGIDATRRGHVVPQARVELASDHLGGVAPRSADNGQLACARVCAAPTREGGKAGRGKKSKPAERGSGSARYGEFRCMAKRFGLRRTVCEGAKRQIGERTHGDEH